LPNLKGIITNLKVEKETLKVINDEFGANVAEFGDDIEDRTG